MISRVEIMVHSIQNIVRSEYCFFILLVLVVLFSRAQEGVSAQYYAYERRYAICPMWGEFTPMVGPLMRFDLSGLCTFENKKIKQALLYEPKKVCLAREGCGLYIGFSY